METKLYEDCILRVERHFKNCFSDTIITNDSSKQEIMLKKQKALLGQYMNLININLSNNIIVEGKETKYFIDNKILRVNPDDPIDYVENVIVREILIKMFNFWPIRDVNYTKRLFLYMFINIGLITVAGKRAINGSKEIVIANYTNLICKSIKD